MKVLLILILIITMILIQKRRSYVKHKKCKHNKKGICDYWSKPGFVVICEKVNYLCEWEEEDEHI